MAEATTSRADLRRDPASVLPALARDPLVAAALIEDLLRSARDAGPDAWDESWLELIRTQSHVGSERMRREPKVARAFGLSLEAVHQGISQVQQPMPPSRLHTLLATLLSEVGATAAPWTSAASPDQEIEIVYFPSGFGRTEGCLAYIVYRCFLERLLGRRSGVVACLGFPLTLLDRAHVQAISSWVGAADRVRSHQLEPALRGEAFSLGALDAPSAPFPIVGPVVSSLERLLEHPPTLLLGALPRLSENHTRAALRRIAAFGDPGDTSRPTLFSPSASAVIARHTRGVLVL